MLDAAKFRHDFPLLSRRIGRKPIVYLDSTATSLKPRAVLNKMNEYYTRYTANVFRGIYAISEEATAEYEKAREATARFIHADQAEIVFTRNTTESLNLLCYSWAAPRMGVGDEVVTTIMEHHSNFVPWQQLALGKKLRFTAWKPREDGLFDTGEIGRLVTGKTKVFAITAVSNVLGTINPVAEIVREIKKANAGCFVIVDAAQAVPHMPVDVSTWGADAIAFSGHKMLAPSGIGALWAKREALEAMKPFLYGGDMIREVHEDRTVFNSIPHKFEAGTPFIEGAIGLGAAVSYLTALGMDAVRQHEEMITEYALKSLSNVAGLTVYGPKKASQRGGVIAFRLSGVHPHDIAQILDEENVCVRVGFHCAQPLHEHLSIGATARASFYIYTVKEDIDALVSGLERVKRVFKV